MAGPRVERMFEDALTALRKMRYNQAYDLFSEAMELEPEMPEIHYNRGIAAGLLHRWEDAAQCFKLAARLSPHADYRVRLGLACLHLRQWREAQYELEAALEMDPGNEVAQSHLRDLRFFLDRPPGGSESCPPLCAGWFDPRLEDYAGIDPVIVPKAERAELRAYIQESFGGDSAAEECDHTHRSTEEWALRKGLDPLGVSRFLYDRGLTCDCRVLAEAEKKN